jgi:hypothetical protein
MPSRVRRVYFTAAAIQKLKPGNKRIEIPDGGSGLRLVIQVSGHKSWAMRFRRPDDHHNGQRRPACLNADH